MSSETCWLCFGPFYRLEIVLWASISLVHGSFSDPEALIGNGMQAEMGGVEVQVASGQEDCPALSLEKSKLDCLRGSTHQQAASFERLAAEWHPRGCLAAILETLRYFRTYIL